MASRPTRRVYPCVTDLTLDATASAVEFSCWLTPRCLATACNTRVCTYLLTSTTTQLALRSTHVLNGSVIGMFGIHGGGNPLLLLAIAPARLSLIELDDRRPHLLPAVSVVDLQTTSGSSSGGDMQVAVQNGSMIACSVGDRLAVLEASAGGGGCLGDPYIIDSSVWGAGVVMDLTVLTRDGLEGAIVVLLHRRQQQMVVTALTVSIVHQRTAVLWTTTKIHHDAQQLQQAGPTALVVVGVNGLQFFETSTGMACSEDVPVNGWCGGPNFTTQPLLRLAIAMDASRWIWLREDTALVVLRRGHVYWLVQQEEEWVLLPTGHTLELCGEVSCLSLQPGARETRPALFVLCGSRLGDSFLLQLETEQTNVPIELVEAKQRSHPKTIIQFGDTDASVEELHDWVHEQDQELYNIVSDDEEPSASTKRQKTSEWLTLRVLKAVDRILGLGPLGQFCEGHATLVPSGYGRSGGVALLTRPGQDERCIISEHDLLHVEVISSRVKEFCCIGTAQKGIQVLWKNETTSAWEQVTDFCSAPLVSGTSPFTQADEIFSSKLLASCVLKNDQTVLVVQPMDTNLASVVVTSVPKDRTFSVVLHHSLEHKDTVEMETLTEIVETDEGIVGFGCVWSDGSVSYYLINLMSNLIVHKSIAPLHDAMKVDAQDIDEETAAVQEFYSNTEKATSVDVFLGARNLFDTKEPSSSADISPPDHSSSTNDAEPFDDELFDDFDRELYGISKGRNTATSTRSAPISDTETNIYDGEPPSLYVAVARQSGDLEIYLVDEQSHILKWSGRGLASGDQCINKGRDEPLNTPRFSCNFVSEMRFFVCGSTQENGDPFASKLCLALLTSDGDTTLYVYSNGRDGIFFRRHFLHMVSRTSEEQGRHKKKLVSKKIVSSTHHTFRYSTFFRFNGISNQQGLFVSCARPFWIVSTRGYPVSLSHRVRHGSPAGGKESPVRGICTVADGSFFTVHERVGRVGSQRLTLFNGIFPPGNTSFALPGGGMLVEKIPLGVTVRKMTYIPLPESSTQGSDVTPHLYALLVSQEEESDQSELNSDGLTDEERAQLQREKEAAKIKKQVEADLGGFDVESEWVEEIERVNYMKVNPNVGGAPPLLQSNYSVWIVDASNSWGAVDSFQLAEFEHGIDLQLMSLSVFKEAMGTDLASEELEVQRFIVVGTGVVNADGEDVATKGRALLFSLKLTEELTMGVPLADMTLVYEKNIFHGPVTTVSCLDSEGISRLVIGAGSDVNIEQWGNGKLTQVGFYRATMHIVDIKHFKDFMILSDAYDSLYFLVWRESDKSLTLLAKDYDPVPVYAASFMSRGSSLTFVCHDNRENFQFFQYAPGEAAARGGNKLVCRADFHLGDTTTSLTPFCCQSSLLVHSATPRSTNAALRQQDTMFGRQDDDQRIGVYFGTTSGAIGAMVPLSEPVYWRLLALQSVLANALENDAALSARSWRHFARSNHRYGCRTNDRKKGVIDGDLALKFAELSISEQEDLASAIGSTPKLILDNLVEIQCATTIP